MTYSEQIKKDSVPRCLLLYGLKKTKNYLFLSSEQLFYVLILNSYLKHLSQFDYLPSMLCI